jgi:hypothetical protein
VRGEALPIFKEVFHTLSLGRCPLKTGAFIANITNEFILGLDNLRAYDASVDLGCQMLRLEKEEVSLWSPGVGPHQSSLAVTNNQAKPAQCKAVLMAQLDSPLGVENGLVEPSWEFHAPKGL